MGKTISDLSVCFWFCFLFTSLFVCLFVRILKLLIQEKLDDVRYVTFKGGKPGFTYISFTSSSPACWNFILHEKPFTSRPFSGFTIKSNGSTARNPRPRALLQW